LLRRIFGPKRNKVIEGRRKLRSEELHNLCCLQNIIRMIKLRRMSWAGHVTQIGQKRTACRLLVESQIERDH
jgi:hypothetical protein